MGWNVREGGVPVCCVEKSLQENEIKGDKWRSVGPRRRLMDDERLKRKGIQASVGAVSVTNLQTISPVVRVEAREAAGENRSGLELGRHGKE